MNIVTLFRLPAAALTLTATLFASGTALSAADDVSAYDLEGINAIEFSITRASIDLIGSDRSDLQVTLEKPMTGFDPDTIEQTVERVGDTLVIKIEYEKTSGSWWWSSDKYKGYSHAELLLPKNIATTVKTSGGNVSAESLQAELNLHTSGGNIAAKHIEAPLNAKTSGGNVKLSNVTGDTYAHTSGGNIVIADLHGKGDFHTSGGRIKISGEVPALKARTSGGSIEVDLKTALTEPLELNTSGGSISATLESGLSAPAKLSTSGGSVSLWIPEDQAFDLYAKTNGGSVNLRHPGTFQGKLERKRIDGSINGGGPSINLSTNGGGIQISKI